MNQDLIYKFKEILSQGIIKAKRIQMSSAILIKATESEFRQLIDILKNEFL